MQHRDPMRESARLDAANREAAYRKPAPLTAAAKRGLDRARGKAPTATPARAQVDHGGPLQKPLVR
jgi:hypothetical protein